MAKKVTMIASPLELLGLTPSHARGIRGIGALSPAWSWVQGVAYYAVQSGDTLGAIAAKYLGSGSRFIEIWKVQSLDYQRLRGNPDNIRVGDRLVMPWDAVSRAQALGFLGPTPAARDDDKTVASSIPEITIYGDGSEPTQAAPPVVKEPDAVLQKPPVVERWTANLEPWQKWAVGGLLFAATATTVVVVARKVKAKRSGGPPARRGRR